MRQFVPLYGLVSFIIIAIVLLIQDRSDGQYGQVIKKTGENQDNEIKQLNSYDSPTYTLPNGTVCNAKLVDSVQPYYDYMDKELYKGCMNSRIFGGIPMYGEIDGEKWVCLDNIKADNCIALSFGINNEWSFDDQMEEYGCKVYSFDPTISAPDHIRNKNIYFYHLGISRTEGILPYIGPVDSYKGILKRLGLIGKDIDYVKIDVEKSEIGVFESWYFDTPEVMEHIKQVFIEVHTYSEDKNIEHNKVEDLARFYKFFQILECFGFRLAFSKMNNIELNLYWWNGLKKSVVYELVWINEKFIKN